MSRMTLLDNTLWLSLSATPSLAGAGKADAGYPPYNIELLPGAEDGTQSLRITFAVAGFDVDELEVSTSDGELVIRGKQCEEGEREYLHRGIAARQFKRSYPLASGVVIGKAELNDGLLSIELKRPRKEKRVVKVGIASAD
jgi:HSP20 family molecular chaperone IbpA